MPLHTIELKSAALDKRTRVNIYINDHVEPPYPVLYLLHGLSDDYSCWLRRTTLERQAQNFPFLIVMPDGARSWYADSALGHYETYIARELVATIDRTFQTSAKRQHRAIGGLSMGGYGALRIGFRHADTFGAIAAHSFASLLDGYDGEFSRSREAQAVRTANDDSSLDVQSLIAACPAKKRPHLHFDCGRDDVLFADNQKLHRALLRQKISHSWQANLGGHNWEYWDAHIADTLRFLCTVTKQAPIDYHAVKPVW